MTSKAELRRAMRQQRRSLSVPEQHRHARQLAAVLARSPVFRRARHVAVYLAADGEPDLGPLMRLAVEMGKHVYLPVVARFNPPELLFRRYRPGASILRPNRYGIPEPLNGHGAQRPRRQLDLVLAPLVAFDRYGRRLGMGGGFYDRSFAFLHHRRRWQHPRLIGVSHSFQEVDELPAEPWDVPLWGVVTERGLRKFGSV